MVNSQSLSYLQVALTQISFLTSLNTFLYMAFRTPYSLSFLTFFFFYSHLIFWLYLFFLSFFFSLKSSLRICLLILEGWKEGGRGEKDRERNMDSLLPVHALTRNWTHNLGMCPDQELNLQPFGVQDNAPTNSATWPGQLLVFLMLKGLRTQFSFSSLHSLLRWSHPVLLH